MNQTAMFSRWSGLLAVVASFLLPIARADDLPSLDRALRTAAPEVLRFAKDRGYANVGVLKFRIKKGAGKLTDNAGPLNLKLSEKLELALILVNDVRQPIGIVHDASSVAAGIVGANHLSEDGRKKLFSTQYPLAWGEAKVIPDAFFVGVAEFSADLSQMTVGIAAFDRRAEKLEPVLKFDCRSSVTNLVETGESFTVRGLFDGGTVETKPAKIEQETFAKVTTQAASVRESTAKHPLVDPMSPVELEVRYDGQLIPFDFTAGEARLREPQESQKVTLTLRRRDPNDRRRYACVLRVNGENTLFRQRQNDLDCNKWVLEPGSPPLVVRGFQKTAIVAAEFRILSQAESKAKEMNYGADVGTIALTVFTEAGSTTPKRPVIDLADEDAEDALIIQKCQFPAEKPKTLDAAKSRLAALSQNRGLIEEGKIDESKTVTVKFETDPRPVMSVTVRYYRR